MAFYAGVNCILIKDNKILLGKRLKKAGFGTWGFPGGHLEQGESFADTASRELMEETGLTADHLTFSSLINTPQSEDHYIQINFIVDEWHGNLENKEPDKCEGLEWFSLDSMPNEIFSSHKDILKALKEKLVIIDTPQTFSNNLKGV